MSKRPRLQPAESGSHPAESDSEAQRPDRVTLDVGGTLFHTTWSTLAGATLG